MAAILILFVSFFVAVITTVATIFFGMTLLMGITTFYSVSLGLLIVLGGIGLTLRSFGAVKSAPIV